MYQFSTYKTSTAGGWFWMVTKEVGPAVLVVARSGHGFVTQEAAITDYKAFVQWAAHGNRPTGDRPPTAQA